MNKKIISLLFAFVLCFLMSFSAFAVESSTAASTPDSTVAESGFNEEYNRVQDFSEVLTADEYYKLNDEYNELIYRQKFDVIFCFTNTLEGKTAKDYAETLFDECNYGYGENRDGVLFLVSFENRDWYIVTHGYGKTVFTSSGIQYIGDKIKDYLAAENYADAVEAFAGICDEFINEAKNESPYNESMGELDNYDSGFEMPPPLWIPISIAVGLIIALIVVLCMKGKLKTVKMQPTANDYLKAGSLNITESRDTFLYSSVTQTAKPKNDDNNGSSSDSDFGGGGGKF